MVSINKETHGKKKKITCCKCCYLLKLMTKYLLFTCFDLALIWYLMRSGSVSLSQTFLLLLRLCSFIPKLFFPTSLYCPLCWLNQVGESLVYLSITTISKSDCTQAIFFLRMLLVLPEWKSNMLWKYGFLDLFQGLLKQKLCGEACEYAFNVLLRCFVIPLVWESL